MKNPLVWISEMELAWAAGLFDGEGSIGFYDRTIMLTVVNCHTELLERFAKAVGSPPHGSIRLRPSKRIEHRDSYAYVLRRHEEVEEVVNRLWSYLCAPKQDQILDAFSARQAYADERNAVFSSGYCQSGHKMTKKNTFVWNSGVMRCVKCMSENLPRRTRALTA